MNYQTEISLLTQQVDRLLEAYQQEKEKVSELTKALAMTNSDVRTADAEIHSDTVTAETLDRIIAEVRECIDALKEN